MVTVTIRSGWGYFMEPVIARFEMPAKAVPSWIKALGVFEITSPAIGDVAVTYHTPDGPQWAYIQGTEEAFLVI